MGLFLSFETELFAYALTVAPTDTDAEDLLHDVLVSAARSGARPECPKAYLFRAIRNAAADLRRRRGVRTRHARVLRPGASLGEPTGTDAETAAAVRLALECLPEQQAEVIVLRLRAGLSFAEIAVALDRPQGTVTGWYSRGVAALRAHVAQASP